MICESGRVVSIENDSVWVETQQVSSCTSCSARVGCGQGLLNSVFAGKINRVKVSADKLKDVVAVNDRVEIAIPEHVMLLGSFWVYVLPLALLIAGAVIGEQWAGVEATNELYSILGAITGFVLACLILRWHSTRHFNNPKYQPVLHSIIQSGSHSGSHSGNQPEDLVIIEP